MRTTRKVGPTRKERPDPTPGHGPHDHDLGLAHDLPTLLSRRRALAIGGGAGLAAALAACTTNDVAPAARTPTPADSTSAGPSSAGAGLEQVPTETLGPFPANGSNGPDLLAESGVVRRDITSSFGGSTTRAAGVPLTIALTILDTRTARPLPGAAVYVWQCDINARYSMYSSGAEAENYLRGVQAADDAGELSFLSIYPAAYSGRWPHIHFEVYPDLASATSASNKLRTSQIALPEETSVQVYATPGYEESPAAAAQTTLESDSVFADGYSLQMATMSGTLSAALTANLVIAV